MLLSYLIVHMLRPHPVLVCCKKQEIPLGSPYEHLKLLGRILKRWSFQIEDLMNR
jgi:hypothetical protein